MSKHEAGKGDRYRRVDPEKWARGWALAFPHQKETKVNMSFDAYERQASETWRGCPVCERPLYLAVAITEEAGEVAGKVKKLYRDHDGGMPPFVREGILFELGDLLYYMSRMAQEMGSSLEEIAQMNNQKLSRRRREGTIRGEGDQR